LAIQLPSSWRYAVMRLGWPPRGRAARWGIANLKFALALLILQGVIVLLGLPGGGTVEALWISALVIALVLFSFAAFAWVRQKLLWRLRNRLIVTYVFIGVIPAILLVSMAFLAFYIFAGQFANFVVTTDLNTELKNLETSNATLARALASHMTEKGNIPFALADAWRTSQASGAREVCAWLGDRTLPVSAQGPACSLKMPSSLPADFRELVTDQGTLSLRTGTTLDTRGGKLRVVTTSPLDQSLLDQISGGLGKVTLSSPITVSANPTHTTGEPSISSSEKSAGTSRSPETPGKTDVSFDNGGQRYSISADLHPLMTSGTLPAPANRFDREINLPGPLFVLDWRTGNRIPHAIVVQTRPSLLYERLFAAQGDFAVFWELVLLVVAITFALIVLLALLVGSRLTQTVTLSVANLYRATQHLNRGEFSHRIEVHERDQLAVLQTSFNSMAGSLEKLMSEQREKQRLENELTIAHEVQEQLFPRSSSQLESLEVHGFCKPARTVSGDYYDFLPITADRLGLAVGDVSGKGISAALLMATIHSAVRAYQRESVPSHVPVLAGGGGSGDQSIPHGSGISPSALMYLLNRQLYNTTPPEKYATMFLGLYDGSSRRLTYTNAGHLPPILLGTNGSIRRLETGGTVVGLFDNISYDESTVTLGQGEIFLAYSDGITEPENDYGEFGEDRLIDLVRENRHLPLDRISELVTHAVQEWIGANEQPDDITLVLARAR